MPFYDYRCTECAREVEVMHGIHDKGPATCQHCGAAMRKALSPPAIHFKGSGWAKKDARKAAPSKAKPAAGASDKSAATGESGTDGAKGSASDTSKTGSTSDSTDSKTASSAGTSSD
jgi:putative FmdB family regulatory protein